MTRFHRKAWAILIAAIGAIYLGLIALAFSRGEVVNEPLIQALYIVLGVAAIIAWVAISRSAKSLEAYGLAILSFVAAVASEWLNLGHRYQNILLVAAGGLYIISRIVIRKNERRTKENATTEKL